MGKRTDSLRVFECIPKVLMILLLFMTFGSALAQKVGTFTISGTVYEIDNGKKVPLQFSTVLISEYSLSDVTNQNGDYKLSKVPKGKVKIKISYLGKLSIDTLINVTQNLSLNFVLKNEDFRIKEVIVSATANKTGSSTASLISRTAMDHLQATSLSDLMTLLPGGLSSNQNLNSASQINIRNIGSGNDMNALGSAIIRDGAPISNNANLQSMNPTVVGATGALGGGAGSAGGIDIRAISVDNIESIEVIRGIPSAEYGDLTSGAVILNTKAGREPLKIRAKANPNIYEVSVGKGFILPKNTGAININGDYAYNVDEPIQSYCSYRRANVSMMYSNLLLNKKLSTNTSFNFMYGMDKQKRNPDDESMKRAHEGKDLGYNLNTRGTYTFQDKWLKNIKYVLSGNYTSKKSFSEELYVAANAPYSQTTIDGTVLSNIEGHQIFDTEGSLITNVSPEDVTKLAYYLPSTYFGHYDIDGKEVNIFAKLQANFFKKWGNTNHRFLIGADYKSDGNVGDGKIFDPTTPPYRNLSASNASYRPRAYKDIPFVNQFSGYAEENFNWKVNKWSASVQAGIRYDYMRQIKGVFAPRINASIDLIPSVLSVTGGYGITVKMPTTLYLYPENAYFEYVNFTDMARTKFDYPLYITTTKVYESKNPDLEAPKNHKSEIGLNLQLGQVRMNVTGFEERMNNGFSFSTTADTYKPFSYNYYDKRTEANVLNFEDTYPVLSHFAKPNNNNVYNTKGIEYDLNLGRIDPIRTSFVISGAWMRTESYNKDYTYYDDSPVDLTERLDVAVYEKEMEKYYRERAVTTLRATHNIPSIGLVVTLTAEAIWKEANWYKFKNDSIPIGYISKDNGNLVFFEKDRFQTVQDVKDADLDDMLRHVTKSYYIKESYDPRFCFNVNVTKEIGDFLRISFFANNMFRSYPISASKRSPGSFVRRNQSFFFGMELSLLLK